MCLFQSIYSVVYININSELAELSFELYIQIYDVNIQVYYDVELARNKVTTDSNADNIDFIKTLNVENIRKAMFRRDSI